MINNNNVSASGIGFTGLLTIVFIALKLLGVVNWSWWWVLSPIWIGVALFVVVLIVLIVIAVIQSRE